VAAAEQTVPAATAAAVATEQTAAAAAAVAAAEQTVTAATAAAVTAEQAMPAAVTAGASVARAAGASVAAAAAIATVTEAIGGFGAAAEGHHQHNTVHLGDLRKRREPTQLYGPTSSGLEPECSSVPGIPVEIILPTEVSVPTCVVPVGPREPRWIVKIASPGFNSTLGRMRHFLKTG
jgi:hypothetical protein